LPQSEALTTVSARSLEKIRAALEDVEIAKIGNYLHSFYLDPTILGRIVVGYAAFEELFGEKSNAERLFKNHDIDILRRLIKKEFGSLPPIYQKMLAKLCDRSLFPKCGLFDRIVNNIARDCKMPQEYVKIMMTRLRNERNKAAHEGTSINFDYRHSLDFVECVLRARIDNLVSDSLPSAYSGPLLNLRGDGSRPSSALGQ
jgi:hypothetical protein